MATLTISKEDEKRVKAMGFLSNKGTDNFSARVITVNGKLTAEQYMAIGEAAKKYGSGELVFTTRLTIEVLGIPYEKIDEFRAYLSEAGISTGGTGSKVRPIVSCKGTTCQYGLIDTYALSEEIHKRFYEGYREVKLPHKFKIAVGGCPNNCVKPDLNDLGIIGQLIPNYDEDLCNGCKKCTIDKICPIGAAKVEDGVLKIDQESCNNCGRCVDNCHFDAIEDGTYGYKMYLGGRWGKSIAKGKAVSRIFTTKEDLMKTVEKVLLFYREQGKTGERFSQTIERLGFDYVEAEILSDDILDRKSDILNARLHETGGATC